MAEKKERENESESSSKRTTMTPGKISPGKWEQITVENAFHQPKSLVWVWMWNALMAVGLFPIFA